MKGAGAYLVAVSLLVSVFGFAATGFAEEEVVGSIVSMDKSHLTVEKKSGEKRRFGWSRQNTRFFSGSMPVPVRHLVPHTKVRVAPKDGAADAIFILEAPK
ncbi:hypothetical protein [Geomesophilobacter sediminis]|uniref:CzcE family metal-binding protein n=1 Tax=Geomesophilobacter sediminis TaxID=2798584 RepID=A0A8J7SAE3_9BACT|nr:hypothetical protein [Geomesophilobacter sediminis]MBJ6727435.1 hypothetical protein [Geomesophilobacter sediminis]